MEHRPQTGHVVDVGDQRLMGPCRRQTWALAQRYLESLCLRGQVIAGAQGTRRSWVRLIPAPSTGTAATHAPARRAGSISIGEPPVPTPSQSRNGTALQDPPSSFIVLPNLPSPGPTTDLDLPGDRDGQTSPSPSGGLKHASHCRPPRAILAIGRLMWTPFGAASGPLLDTACRGGWCTCYALR